MSVFHDGELALQRRAGSLEPLAQAGPRVIRDHMPGQHRAFFAQLPFIVAGAVDDEGQPWASVLAGRPGFVSSPDPHLLHVAAAPLPHDPLQSTLRDSAAIGLLGIEPHTRRRNRMNGTVRYVGPEGFEVAVSQSFGNCPKYIQARKAEYDGSNRPATLLSRATALDDASRELIGRADTFFIASAHPLASRRSERWAGVDVSHRGGQPGFVRVDGAGLLTVPDFIGNSFFNTLGNLALNPRCGLLFIDYELGDLLYLACRAGVEWNGPELHAFPGAQRLLRLEVGQALRVGRALPLRWGPVELSPFLAAAGS
jgi:predicted pyridoxine 5'-phosphate oxidase superfamily flavin-nucleotide-binding protein